MQWFSDPCDLVERVGSCAGFLFDSFHWCHGGCQRPRGLPVWQVHLAVGEVMAAVKVREAERLFAGGIVDLGSYPNQLRRVCCGEGFREGGAI